MMTMMSKDGLQIFERRGIFHQISRFIDHEHDFFLSLFGSLIHERDQQFHQQTRLPADRTALLDEIQVQHFLVANIEITLPAQVPKLSVLGKRPQLPQ